MSRLTLPVLLLALLAPTPQPAGAGQPDNGSSPKSPTATAGSHPAPIPTSSGVMQIKEQLTGDFSYRFTSPTDKSGAPATAPVPLPAPSTGENIIAISIPSTAPRDGQLEVLDNGRGNVARLPISPKRSLLSSRRRRALWDGRLPCF